MMFIVNFMVCEFSFIKKIGTDFRQKWLDKNILIEHNERKNAYDLLTK